MTNPPSGVADTTVVQSPPLGGGIALIGAVATAVPLPAFSALQAVTAKVAATMPVRMVSFTISCSG